MSFDFSGSLVQPVTKITNTITNIKSFFIVPNTSPNIVLPGDDFAEDAYLV